LPFALVLTAHPLRADDDKNGVSPNTISRPTGPGSLEGLGDAFQPALNTGMARYTVEFALPGGVAGFTPELSLQYDSGRGFGPVGIGWTFGPGTIRRQTEKGLPRYGDAPAGGPDRFLGSSGEELVPLDNGHYLAKIEGAYVRCRRVGDHWEAHTKRGSKMEYGLTSEARVTDATGTKVYEWYLQRRTDTHGNVIEYDYIRPIEDDRQVYLSEIRYGPGPGPWPHAYKVRVFYEERPDPRTDYRSGFRIRTSRRVDHIDMLYDDALIRRYSLGYGAHAHWSLLTTITQYGADGVTTLPVTTFGYAVLDLPDPQVPLSATGHVIGSTGEPGLVVDNPNIDFIDINADGLPDMLETDTGHLAYLNRGAAGARSGQTMINWQGPVDLAPGTDDVRAFGFELSQPNVHLADMDGDGLADLVVTEAEPDQVEYFPSKGQAGWGGGRFMSIEQAPPPAPFGPGGVSVRTTDLDFDKRMDVVRSQDDAYSIWFNLGGGRYSPEVLRDGAWHGYQFIDFAEPGVQLADMNGDRLSDVVKVTSGSVVYCASMGYGFFDDAVEIPLAPEDPALEAHHIARAKLTDVNGDGLSDLVVERFTGSELRFWLNMGDDTFSRSRVVIALPATSEAVTRWVDINGNGTTDLVYADSTLPPGSKISAVDLGVLIAGSAYLNALTSIDNGYGRRTVIAYRSSTDFYVDAYSAGHPWTTSVPFPVAVVSQTRTSIGLDLDGFPDEGPDGDVYLTDYVYRDGYYDFLEKQFRGFAFVKQIQRGDERSGGTAAPTLVTRYGFHTGAPDGEDNDGNGQTDEYDEWAGREEEALKGLGLWKETCAPPDDLTRDGLFADDSVVFERVETTWEVRNLCTDTAGSLADLLGAGYTAADEYGRGVRQAVATRVQRSVVERRTDVAEHKFLENRSDVDPLGNTLFEWKLGEVSNPNDDLYTGYEYGRNETGWIVGLVSRTFERAGTPDGAFVSEIRNYYDGLPFEGLPLGEVGDEGNLHRTESLISGGQVPELTERSFLRGDPRDPSGRVDVLRQKFDDFGNVAIILGANASLGPDGLPDGNGHERRITYDPWIHRFPIRETIVLGDGSPDLEVTASYHLGFGTPLTVTDFNGNVTRYTYDELGRLHTEIVPGDDPAAPTNTYLYDLGDPFSTITTISHVREGDSADVETRQYFDGLGRTLGTFEVGGSAMQGVTQYNPRGLPYKTFEPYFGTPVDGAGDWLLPDPGAPATVTHYDASGRTVETISPPDEDGITAHTTTVYAPLIVVQYDREDTRTGGRHAGTPKTLVSDGLERLIEVREIETISNRDSGEFVTKYRYALPDLLAEIEDANGNIKYMRYDGLGRRIFMNDCDRGHMVHSYDAAGNVLSTTDGRGQQITYTYDGANRLLSEDYLDIGTPLSLERTPDVKFHYDKPADAYPMLRNLRGQLAWLEDLTGSKYHGFDARGKLETVIHRVDQPDGTAQDWTSVSLFDSLGRLHQSVYPDGSVVCRRYDARGMLEAVPGFVDALAYEASGKRATCTYANGVVTRYTYDPRQRLIRLLTQSGGELIQDLSYDYDQVDNILEIVDGRTLPPDDPRTQTASFLVDNTYRLVRAAGAGYGTIDYDYDRLGNMLEKTSPDIGDPDVHMGEMTSGGAGGTAGRIGRMPGDPPGPHAITSAYDGVRLRTYSYDDNGNMITNDGDGYMYDFKDRLGRVNKDSHDIRYLYDHAGRRVIKRVDGEQTTYVSKLAEVRGGGLLKYVFAGAARVARVDGAMPLPERLSQRLSLVPGWNLFSFQLTPDSSDPATILADVDGRYTVVYGYSGSEYVRFAPGRADNTLTALAPNHGYWIHMTEAGELLVEGPMSETSVDVPHAGFALVGLPGLAPRDIDELQAQYSTVRAVWVYAGDNVGWRLLDGDAPDYVGTLHRTAPGLGYWVTADEAVSLNEPPATPGDILHYHGDHIGSISAVTDSDGRLSSEFCNYPFGLQRYEHHIGGPFEPHYQFTGKERDEESGLHYFEARYYGSPLARFASVDPLLANRFQLEVPQKLNLYAYANNRPLIYTDPTGLDIFDTALDVLGTVTDVALSGTGVTGMFSSPAQLVSEIKTARHAGAVETLFKTHEGSFVTQAEATSRYTQSAKTTGLLTKANTVMGYAGIGLGFVQTVIGAAEDKPEDVVGGLANSQVAAIGMKGGHLGAIFAISYCATDMFVAPFVDRKTGYFDDAVIRANQTEADITEMTGSETLGSIVGTARAAAESMPLTRAISEVSDPANIDAAIEGVKSWFD
jgi:RHS repeat-associated protein